MDISLTEEWESYVGRKIGSGLYPSASEVVSDGLKLMKQRDELRKAIAVGVEQAERGLMHAFDEQTLASVKAKGRERLNPPF